MTETISPQTHVARGATFIFIQGLLNAGFGVLYVWFLLHTKEITGQALFTESDFGIFTMLSFILNLTAMLGMLALRQASVRYIARYVAEGRMEAARSVVTRVLQISAITSLIIMASLLILAGTLSGIFANPLVVFYLLPLTSAFQIFYHQSLGFLQGLQKMREMAFLGVCYTAVQYSVAVALVYAGFGILGIVVSWLLAQVLLSLVSLAVSFRSIGFSSQAHEVKPLLTFSLPIYVATLLTFAISWVDQIFVFPFMGIEALGVYSLAVRASVVPNLVSHSILITLFPKLTELHSVQGSGGLGDAFKTSTRYAAFLGFPASLLVAVLAYPIVVLFATVTYVDAVLPLAIMCIAALPTVLGSAIIPTLYTLERTRTASLIQAISIGAEAIFSYVSLALLSAGLSGVALSRLLATSIPLVLGVYVLRRLLKVEFDREAAWKAALASAAMVLSIFLLELVRANIEPLYQLLVLRLRHLPIYAATGMVVYMLSLIALRSFERRDMQLLREYLPSRFRWLVDVLSRISRVE